MEAADSLPRGGEGAEKRHYSPHEQICFLGGAEVGCRLLGARDSVAQGGASIAGSLADFGGFGTELRDVAVLGLCGGGSVGGMAGRHRIHEGSDAHGGVIGFVLDFLGSGEFAEGSVVGAFGVGGVALQGGQDIWVRFEHVENDGGIGVGGVEFGAGEVIECDGFEALGAGEEPLGLGELFD
jgi:hypothetical protein